VDNISGENYRFEGLSVSDNFVSLIYMLNANALGYLYFVWFSFLSAESMICT